MVGDVKVLYSNFQQAVADLSMSVSHLNKDNVTSTEVASLEERIDGIIKDPNNQLLTQLSHDFISRLNETYVSLENIKIKLNNSLTLESGDFQEVFNRMQLAYKMAFPLSPEQKALEIPNNQERSEALLKIALEYASAKTPDFDKAVETAMLIPNSLLRGDVLNKMIKDWMYLTPLNKKNIESVARAVRELANSSTMPDEEKRCKILSAFATQLIDLELTDEAYAVAKWTPNSTYQSRVLYRICLKLLENKQWSKAIEVAKGITSPLMQARILIPIVNEEQLADLMVEWHDAGKHELVSYAAKKTSLSLEKIGKLLIENQEFHAAELVLQEMKDPSARSTLVLSLVKDLSNAEQFIDALRVAGMCQPPELAFAEIVLRALDEERVLHQISRQCDPAAVIMKLLPLQGKENEGDNFLRLEAAERFALSQPNVESQSFLLAILFLHNQLQGKVDEVKRLALLIPHSQARQDALTDINKLYPKTK